MNNVDDKNKEKYYYAYYQILKNYPVHRLTNILSTM